MCDPHQYTYFIFSFRKPDTFSLFHIISYSELEQLLIFLHQVVGILFSLLYSMYPSCLSSYFCLQASYFFSLLCDICFYRLHNRRVLHSSDGSYRICLQWCAHRSIWACSFSILICLPLILLFTRSLSSTTFFLSFHRFLSIDRCAFLCFDTLLWSLCVIYYCAPIITPSTSPDYIARFISIPFFHSLRHFTAT